MRKLRNIIALLALAVLSSCDTNTDADAKPKPKNEFEAMADSVYITQFGRSVRVYTIDSCEYILWSGSHGEIGYTHKGNCKWCNMRNPCK